MDDHQNMVDVHIDKDHDLIFCSVGLYKMFLANRSEGLEAKQLYDHLLFTARLQETNIIHANNSYLSKGLGWGQVKIKRAKTFLKKKGLISYVQRRGPSGQLHDVFIQVNFFRREPQIEESYDPERAGQLALFGFMTGSTESIPPVKTEKPAGDIKNDLPAGTTDTTGGTKSIPPAQNAKNTGGMADRPAVDRTYGDEQQMLKERNKMLKERKGKRADARISLSSAGFEIWDAFKQYYRKKMQCDPAELTAEEIKLVEQHLSRFGKLKLLDMLYAFFSDQVENIAEFAQKAGYRYKVFSSQLETLVLVKRRESKQNTPEPPAVCPTCGGTHWRSTVGSRMCTNCRTFVELKDGVWEVDPETVFTKDEAPKFDFKAG